MHKLFNLKGNNMSNDLNDETMVMDMESLFGDQSAVTRQAELEVRQELEIEYPASKIVPLSQMQNFILAVAFLIDGVLAANQLGVIAGHSKALKTTLAVLMCISLASGRPFLGVYNIPTRKKVMILSGESGGDKLLATVQAGCQSLGIALSSLDDYLFVSDWIPDVVEPTTLLNLDMMLAEHQPDVVVLDPLYLILADEQASAINNGKQLRKLASLITNRGATPVFVDHFKVTTKEKGTPTLRDLCGAGKAAAPRQWILLKRVKQIQPGPMRNHILKATIGGSQGHFQEVVVEIQEAFENNRLQTLQGMVSTDQSSVSDDGHAGAGVERSINLEEQVVRFLSAQTELVLMTTIRDALSVDSAVCREALATLMRRGVVELIERSVRSTTNRRYDGYRLVRTNVVEPAH